MVWQSFVGGSGGIILDDGRAFGFQVSTGATSRSVTSKDYQALVDVVSDDDFFSVPESLHIDGMTDGNETFLTGVTDKADHTFVNYMDPHDDFGDTLNSNGAQTNP